MSSYSVTARLAEWSKASDLRSDNRTIAWVRTPHLATHFFCYDDVWRKSKLYVLFHSALSLYLSINLCMDLFIIQHIYLSIYPIDFTSGNEPKCIFFLCRNMLHRVDLIKTLSCTCYDLQKFKFRLKWSWWSFPLSFVCLPIAWAGSIY